MFVASVIGGMLGLLGAGVSLGLIVGVWLQRAVLVLDRAGCLAANHMVVHSHQGGRERRGVSRGLQTPRPPRRAQNVGARDRQIWRGSATSWGPRRLLVGRARRCGRGRRGRYPLRDQWGRAAGVQSSRGGTAPDGVGPVVDFEPGS